MHITALCIILVSLQGIHLGASQTYPDLAAKTQYSCGTTNTHTVCLYPGVNTNNCGRTAWTRDLTPAQKSELLKAHNDKRRLVAKGLQKGQPAAANMAILTWDNEAAAIAQLWVDQCIFGHDRVRDTVKNGTLKNGQNFFWSTAATLNISQAMKSWFDDEVGFFVGSTATLSKFSFDSRYGHYTQIVWARTIRMGCGYMFSAEKRQQFLACNFAPAGNMVGSQMYIPGPACSACPPDMKNCVDGLCSY